MTLYAQANNTDEENIKGEMLLREFWARLTPVRRALIVGIAEAMINGYKIGVGDTSDYGDLARFKWSEKAALENDIGSITANIIAQFGTWLLERDKEGKNMEDMDELIIDVLARLGRTYKWRR